MIDTLTTERTLLRPFTFADVPAAFTWLSDPEVMRFIPGALDHDLADTQNRVARYISHQELHGFSKWVIVDRATGACIGDSGLFYLPDGERVELGYRLHRDFWGKGYAPEVARSWITFYQQRFPRRALHAIALPQNVRSVSILDRLGFRPVGDEIIYDCQFRVFSLAPAFFTPKEI